MFSCGFRATTTKTFAAFTVGTTCCHFFLKRNEESKTSTKIELECRQPIPFLGYGDSILQKQIYRNVLKEMLISENFGQGASPWVRPWGPYCRHP